MREAIATGLREGRGPYRTALDISGRVNRATGRREGGIVGLTARQAGHVAAARAQLADPDQLRGYLTRKLRDKRYDPTVRRALREGRGLTRAEIDRISGRYADRMLKHRADMIARTETLTAMSAGRNEGVAQLIEAGKLDPDGVMLVWRATGDRKTRHSHMAMNRQSVPFGGAFTTPEGYRMRFPGDTSLGAPASETIQCRCYLEIKIDRYRGLI